MSSITDEILLHLHNCIDYGFSYRMKKGLWILDHFDHWDGKAKQKEIRGGIRDLNKLKFIKKKENYDGSVVVTLTDKGKLRALNITLRRFYYKKEKWDGKWRMVAFDIPDEYRKGRKALRYRLLVAGFYELQESLFLHPYDCQKELIELVKLFKLEKYVRFGMLDSIDNEKNIKFKFGIS